MFLKVLIIALEFCIDVHIWQFVFIIIIIFFKIRQIEGKKKN